MGEMSYEQGKLIETIIKQNEQIIEMLKVIGDMVYVGTPKKKKKNEEKEEETQEDDIKNYER